MFHRIQEANPRLQMRTDRHSGVLGHIAKCAALTFRYPRGLPYDRNPFIE
jgi:hypothetical protein